MTGDGPGAERSGVIEPPPSSWEFPPPPPDADDLVTVGADLEPGTLLAAYRAGYFPMNADARTLGWWSPNPRGILPIDGLRVTRSLRKSCARFEIRVDHDLPAVIDACGDPSRNGHWITPAVRAAYLRLHDLGWVHSVEAYDLVDGALAGGLYGVAIGGLFAGESMFHRRTDASKVALVGLAQLLGPAALLDVQWRTEHLASLGVVNIPRTEYLRRLAEALERPTPASLTGAGGPPFVANAPQ